MTCSYGTLLKTATFAMLKIAEVDQTKQDQRREIPSTILRVELYFEFYNTISNNYI